MCPPAYCPDDERCDAMRYVTDDGCNPLRSTTAMSCTSHRQCYTRSFPCMRSRYALHTVCPSVCPPRTCSKIKNEKLQNPKNKISGTIQSSYISCSLIIMLVDMCNIMLMRLQVLRKSCRVPVILFYFILSQSGKILAQFVCKSFILFYFIANGRIA